MIFRHDIEACVSFSAPWEARIFAIVVSLHENGHIDWDEWTQILGDVIGERSPCLLASMDGDMEMAANMGEDYYHHWLEALERLLKAKKHGLPVKSSC